MKIKNIEIFPEPILDIVNKQEFLGIRLSGGIDSAILCYTVLKFFPEVKLIPITFYNHLRPNAKKSVDNVLHAINNLVPNNNLLPQEISYFDTTGYIRDPESKIKKNPKDILQKNFIKFLFDKYSPKLNFILSGETLNPPEEIRKLTGIEDQFPRYRNELGQTLMQYNYNKTIKYEYAPFRNNTKKEVAEICEELGLLEKLFPYTESCESTADQYENYYSKVFNIAYTEPGIEPCQCCWPCREKYWAYGMFDFNTNLRANKIYI